MNKELSPDVVEGTLSNPNTADLYMPGDGAALPLGGLSLGELDVESLVNVDEFPLAPNMDTNYISCGSDTCGKSCGGTCGIVSCPGQKQGAL